MEWSKSDLSGTELERRRREYMDAAMNMSRRAVSDGIYEREAQAATPAVETPAEEAAEPEIPHEPEEMQALKEQEPEETHEPEEMHEPEELPESRPERKTFGVFDMEQLSEAVRNGEMDGDKLKEAAEILEEMSGKTREMQKLAGQPESAAADGKPQSLNSYIERHNNGSCPRCGGRRGGNGS